MIFNYLGHYYTWANNRFRVALAELTEKEFNQKDSDIERSMRDLVIHQITTNEYYLRSPEEVMDLSKKLEEMSIEKVLAFWKESDLKFAEKINEDNKGEVEMPVGEGKTISINKEEMIFAYTDHSTMHRGQILSLLRKYGKKGVNSDFYTYLMVKYA